MIYLDNAATSHFKPKCVIDALLNDVKNSANCGRSVHKAMEGNIAEAETIMADLTEPISLLFREGNPTGIKSMTAAMGITRAEVRLPLVEGSDTLYHDIKSAITKYELR